MKGGVGSAVAPGVEHTLAPLLVREDPKGEAIAGGMIARPRLYLPLLTPM